MCEGEVSFPLFVCFCLFVCLFLYETGFLYTAMAVLELCRSNCPWTQRAPPASTSGILGLKACATILSTRIFKESFGGCESLKYLQGQVWRLPGLHNWDLGQPGLYRKTLSSKMKIEPGVVVHAFNPSTWEAEAGRSLSSRPAWSTEWVPGQPGLHRETLSRKTKKKKIIYFIYVSTLSLSSDTHQKRASNPITDDCEPQCGSWELNSRPLEEQSVLLTAEPSLHSKSFLL
jgi:hypothetical protein